MVLYGAKDAKLEDKEIPELTDPHDVLVRIAYVGVCGSDVSPDGYTYHTSLLACNLQSSAQLPTHMQVGKTLTHPGPLLAPRRHRQTRQPQHRYSNGPRSLGHNPPHRFRRLQRVRRRPRSYRARDSMPHLHSLQKRHLPLVSPDAVCCGPRPAGHAGHAVQVLPDC